MLLFKVLVNGRSCHGGAAEYPPPGEWTARISPSCCKSGWHLTSDPLRWWTAKASLWLAEGDGLLAGDGSDKAAFERVRIVEQITRDWKYLPMFPRVRAFLVASIRSEDANSDILWANLAWANLTGANLDGANLAGANLTWANLAGANWRGRTWRGRTWMGATWRGEPGGGEPGWGEPGGGEPGWGEPGGGEPGGGVPGGGEPGEGVPGGGDPGGGEPGGG